MTTIPTPDYKDIEKAHKIIAPYIHRTPVFTCRSIDEMLDTTIFFKCENFQKVGAFKFRGATHAIKQLSKSELKKGVTTHSSGNHAQALSLAAKMMNVPAYIVMPRTAPDIKVKAVEGYGAEITFCEPTLDAREETLKEVQKETGATFIHPYNNYNVICGQGTVVKELLEDYPDLDVVIAPVGGGGLLSGTAITTRHFNQEIKVYAGEPKNADDAFRSFEQGVLIPSMHPNTIADGLLTSLSPLTFRIIRENVDDIFTAKEENIIKAMRMIWERMKIIVEPSAAVPLAAIIENRYSFKGKKIGMILSGGNVQLDKLPF